MVTAYQPVKYSEYRSGNWETIDHNVIVETPVDLTVNGEFWLTFMCTPVNLEEMMVGFLFNEGLIQSREEIADVRLCKTGDNVDVWLHHSLDKPKHWRRTTGCTGGVTSVNDQIKASSAEIKLRSDSWTISPERICQLIEELFEAQDLYRISGGVHTSALSDGQRIQVSAEDIGRHNTLDKIAGKCLIEYIWPETRILISTGRISSEMLQKSVRIGASILISRTSPSSLSIQLANRYGITLIGYARRNHFIVYTRPERIFTPSPVLHS